ncbi:MULTISPECIES: hydrolase [Gulbenkiania]|uniref:Nicotinamidase-related amidase n=2 Tax=Gulbenkiania TaxID=397456 RepID=A0A0K6GSJ6_9NEIS|nr:MULTISPECIES: hydrolase [Gulbenkiania]TCW32312.1 nicotinamidase-related amidase [Gulbenkiania mobilis]CUA81582.1 Nicotinamidase-related amidase [Gulbenkiania indica]
MLMDREQATLLVVDIQEKLLPAVEDAAGLMARTRWLLGVAQATGLPVVFSEQYPQGLGPTMAVLLEAAPHATVVEKKHFSCLAADCLPEMLLERDQVIVCGMEAHVCVLQTVLELLAVGKAVFVVEDAISSRRGSDRLAAIARMRAAGAVIVTREMVLFEMLRTAGTPQFKLLSQQFLLGEQP